MVELVNDAVGVNSILVERISSRLGHSRTAAPTLLLLNIIDVIKAHLLESGS
jgi:hypothetical protein